MGSKRPKKQRGERFVIREVASKDLDPLVKLAAHLDSVNFPNDAKTLSKVLDRAKKSFRGKIDPPDRREYMFVLEGATSKQVVGTSMLFAQHGHKDEPHTFFDVIEDERYSSTLDRHFRHIYLRLGFEYQGPTEIGGLVLDPQMRGRGLGKLLSFCRFAFIAMYRTRFRPTVIAELMPPLTPDGKSELWDHLGRKFTGIDYQEADKLSRTNKEFIVSLFPHGPVNASLLPERVQKLIGQVGEETKGVRKMLESIGFEYSHRIDPFDGGPHLKCATDKVSLVQGARRWELVADVLPPDADRSGLRHTIVGRGEKEGPTKFRATTAFVKGSSARLLLDSETAALIRAKPGDLVWTVPL